MKKLALTLALLLNACGAAADLPASCSVAASLDDGADCIVCTDGQRPIRAYGGPDGWCEYDGTSCACHGHGSGDLCAQLVADYAACR